LHAMKSSVRLCLGLVAVSSFVVLTACSDDDDDGSPGSGAGSHQGGADAEGGEPAVHGGAPTAHGGAGQAGEDGHGQVTLECKVLGELCHAADTGEGAASDCHELGHVGDAETCASEFAGCVATCTDSNGAGGAGGGGGTDQDPHCAALGSLCHAADTGSGTAHDCHELGHTNNAADCAEGFDACATFCLAALEELEAGAGGAASGGAASGGAASGGAGGAR
jgi:hypothetical protein